MDIDIKKLKKLMAKDLEYALGRDYNRKRLREIEAQIEALSEEAEILNAEDNAGRFGNIDSTAYILDLLHAEIKRAKNDEQ